MRTYEEKQLADWLAYSNAELPLLLRHNIFVRSDLIQERGGGGRGGGEDQQQRKIEMDLKGRLGWTTMGQFVRGYSWVMVKGDGEDESDDLFVVLHSNARFCCRGR